MNQVYNLGKIISEEEADRLASIVLKAKEEGKLNRETNTTYYKDSYGGVTEGTHELLRKLTSMVREITGIMVEPANPFSRIYYNESILRPHVDREGLDWTISLCLFTNINHDWPLKAKMEDGTIVEFPTVKCEGNLINGRNLTHWREALSCEPDECVVQLFLHWTAPSPR